MAAQTYHTRVPLEAQHWGQQAVFHGCQPRTLAFDFFFFFFFNVGSLRPLERAQLQPAFLLMSYQKL